MPVTLLITAVLAAGFLAGIKLMQYPGTAVWGNRLGALCMLAAILITFHELGIAGRFTPWLYVLCGSAAGIALGQKVKIIQMPQVVALLNGLGGGVSALVAVLAVSLSGAQANRVFDFTASTALSVGILTFSGSAVAVLKLQGWISPGPVFLKARGMLLKVLLAAGVFFMLAGFFAGGIHFYPVQTALVLAFAAYGLLAALRIGGADMPILVAFLNSLSGIAAAVCGVAVNNIILACIGAVVGVAGMILTRIMCTAMNRKLSRVLGGFINTHKAGGGDIERKEEKAPSPEPAAEEIAAVLRGAETVVIVPGYGMAVAQAQHAVKQLADKFENRGKKISMAIHPVAGRMPGHMHVLLAEAGIPYDKLLDMDIANPKLPETDLVIAVGACDVINPAARTARDTPIYGMPILQVDKAKNVIVCNLDDKPGYSGVENDLYRLRHVKLLLGDASETVPRLAALLDEDRE